MTDTATGPLPASVLEALGRYDTPTICNAMEIVAPERRLIGYTTKQLVCPFPDLPPIVGYARTVAIRSVLKNSLPPEEQSKRRIDYYEYVGTGFGPRISVIQDIDGPDVGYGAFWGEVQSNVHKALGCLGVITDGSIRDIPQWAPGLPGAGRLDRTVACLGACGELWRRGARRRHDREIGRSDPRRSARRDRDPARHRRKTAPRRRALRPPRDADPRDRPQPRLLAGEAQGRAEALC
ncbi:hypothetical protein ACVWWR_006433 [Bradyrhizobium sp. LM3.2]